MIRLCTVVCLFLSSVVAGADDAPAIRLVSLSPNLTELVYAMGLESHLVGRSSACDYPSSVTNVAVVGGFGRPNREALRQARPDVVIATDLEQPGIARHLEAYDVKLLSLPCESWAGLKTAAVEIGRALESVGRADAWVEQLDARLAALRERVRNRLDGCEPARVYVEVWGRPITTAGGDSFLHEVIEAAGGRNIAHDLRGGYPTISSEWVIRENPEVVLLAYMLSDLRAADAVTNRLGWASIAAVRDGRVVDGIDPDLLLRPGPRLIDGAEKLADALAAMAVE